MSKENTPPQKITVSLPKDWAAGVPAVISAYKNVGTKVGAIKGSKLLLEANQKQGFDCPGCAWPDPLGHRATFEFCENGAKAIADEATRKRADAEFFAQYNIEQLKAESDRWLNDQGRLVEPLFLDQSSEHYRPISWEAAFELIADELNALNSADEAAFYTSGRTSNEAAFLYQLFVRAFGTNNLPDCSNMCHESSGVGLKESIGVGKGTVTLEDLHHSKAIFIFGQNPGSNHPRMLSALQKAKRNGATIITINPLDETGSKRFKNPQEIEGVIGAGTALRNLHLPVKINGDVALLTGLCKYLLEQDELNGNVLDHDFIASYCYNFDAFKQQIQASDWQAIETVSGINKAQIIQAAELYMQADSAICCWAMGMTQHKNAVANIQMMTNFLMLRGNLGKPGAGVCPVRGHSNVQGDRTMGIWERPSQALLDAIEQEFHFQPPQHHGVDAVQCADDMLSGKIKVFFAMGGNFYSAMPDNQRVGQGLSNCSLTVQVSTKLNRSHLYHGKRALILPALGRTEIDTQASGIQIVTVENSMGVVQTSYGKIPPASEHLKSEVAIIAELADKVFATRGTSNNTIPWLSFKQDYRHIRDHIAKVIPGFEDFNQRIEKEGEFQLPNAVRDARRFDTATGKANFTCHDIEPIDVPEGCFILMTLRSHDQFNTTIYTDNDRYRGIHGTRKVLFINKHDIASLNLKAGDRVDITSHWQDEPDRTITGFQLVEYAIPQGSVGAYYPETNDLITLGSKADKSNTPAYKSVVVSLRKSL
ncbi:FdhF/YdeP family oxidoreductase [Paraneptunicella aestuarii]|uniref:FdhF/YdeP family oxidoreductase n=1 Tax=Paraneptunicella aestuarii TaxID=2831148 RepID=UPI001E5C824D|nr:FdhF/YdeP family oxidoreductase [Paraneptunicella aestuarii]UAA38572.1 FdhF/YdeP family oxidoreductase [Paraneptunicella aestuarii]